MPEDFITLTEAAQRIGCRYQLARDRVLEGKLTGKQVDGRRWIVSRESVERFLRERRTAGAVAT